MNNRYLDARGFTRLFRQRHKNHAEICLGLRLLAGGVAARFWFRCADDRREIEANALLHAIERIDRFKFARGMDAFCYFTSLIYHNVCRQMRASARNMQRAALFTDVNGSQVDHEREHSILDTAKPYTCAV